MENVKEYLVYSRTISGIEDFISQQAVKNEGIVDVGDLERASEEKFGFCPFEVIDSGLVYKFERWKDEVGIYGIVDGKIDYNS